MHIIYYIYMGEGINIQGEWRIYPLLYYPAVQSISPRGSLCCFSRPSQRLRIGDSCMMSVSGNLLKSNDITTILGPHSKKYLLLCIFLNYYTSDHSNNGPVVTLIELKWGGCVKRSILTN